MKLFPIILENSCRVVTLFQLFFVYNSFVNLSRDGSNIFYEQGTLRPNMLLHIWVDFSLLFKNPREIKIFRNFSLSWRNILVDWFTISQLSKYTNNSMWLVGSEIPCYWYYVLENSLDRCWSETHDFLWYAKPPVPLRG